MGRDGFDREVEHECPLVDCEFTATEDEDAHAISTAAEQVNRHIERAHYGEVRVTVTFDRTLPLHAKQSPQSLADSTLDRVEDELPGFEAAYASVEVVEEPDEWITEEPES